MRRYAGASIRARQKRWCLAVHCGLSPSQRHAAISRELWPSGRYWLAALMHRWLFFPADDRERCVLSDYRGLTSFIASGVDDPLEPE